MKISDKIYEGIRQNGKYETPKYEYKLGVNRFGQLIVVQRKKGNAFEKWYSMGYYRG